MSTIPRAGLPAVRPRFTHPAQPDRRRAPRARHARRRVGAARRCRLLGSRRRRRRRDGDRRRHGHRAGVHLAPADRDRGVAGGGDPRPGTARGGDSLGRRRGRLPARAPRARDHGRRHVVRAGRPVGGALAARADRARARCRRRRSTRSSRASASRPATPRRRASRSSSCTPPTRTCSPSSCRRRPTSAPAPTRSPARAQIVGRIAAAIRRSAPALILGIRLSIDGEREGGFSLDGLCELLPAIAPLVDYVSVTVGVRTTYVRDMATTEPPLLGAIDRLRASRRPVRCSSRRRSVGPTRSRPRSRPAPTSSAWRGP